MRLLLHTTVMGLLIFPAAAEGQEAPARVPIPSYVADFVRDQYAAVPTPAHFITAIEDASCVWISGANQPDFRMLDGSTLKGLFVCDIEADHCEMPVTAPVWIGLNGRMWFGPDSAASLYATQCLGRLEGG